MDGNNEFKKIKTFRESRAFNLGKLTMEIQRTALNRKKNRTKEDLFKDMQRIFYVHWKCD